MVPTLLLLGALNAFAGAQDAFDAGVAASRAGDYAASEDHFREALEAGGRDPAVYHGLGNALFRQGRTGLAIAAWRRGLSLDPQSGDLAANLDFARDRTTDRLDPPEPALGPFFWQRSLSVARSAALASAAWTLVLGALLLRRLARRPGAGDQLQRVSARLGPWTWGAAALGALLTASTLVALRAAPGAVVIVPVVAARSTTGPDGVDLFVLHEGAEVRVTESTPEAALVLLPDERKGWIAWSALASTDPAAPLPDPML